MAIASPSKGAPAGAGRLPTRQAWIDNLRVAIITGVIGAHVCLIYVLDVGWYYEERTASPITEALLAGLFAPGLLFGMGLMFLVAGLVTPRALARKGARRFATDRLWRLGLPTLGYLFVVNPAMDFAGDHAMGGGEGLGDYLRRTYWNDVGLGIAWFMAALLLFSLAYAGWRSRHRADPAAVGPLRRREAVTAAAVIVVGSFLVRLVWPFLGTDAVVGMNLWEYPQMAVAFALGVLAAERGWLDDGLTPELRRAAGRAAAVGVGAAVLVGVAITITDDPDPFLGGLRAEALLIPVVEATIAVGAALWAMDWFRRRWNEPGPLLRRLGRTSFAAYLLHAPITVLFAASLRDVEVPAEVKFVVVLGLSLVASFGLGELLTRRARPGRGASPSRPRRWGSSTSTSPPAPSAPSRPAAAGGRARSAGPAR